MVSSQSDVESVRRETTRAKTLMTVVLLLPILHTTLVVGFFPIDEGPIELLLPV